MAIVPNKDGQGLRCNGFFGAQVDRQFATPLTAGAGVPSAASIYASQLHLNSTTDDVYRAMETGTTTWTLTVL